MPRDAHSHDVLVAPACAPCARFPWNRLDDELDGLQAPPRGPIVEVAHADEPLAVAIGELLRPGLPRAQREARFQVRLNAQGIAALTVAREAAPAGISTAVLLSPPREPPIHALVEKGRISAQPYQPPFPTFLLHLSHGLPIVARFAASDIFASSGSRKVISPPIEAALACRRAFISV